MAQGIYGLGARLVMASLSAATSGSTSQTVVELTNIGDVSMSADDIDISSHSARTRSFLKGLVDMGEVPFEGNYKTTQGPKIKEYLASRHSTLTQTIAVPGKFKMTFPGYIKGFAFGIPHDGKVSMSGSIKIGGSASLTTSTS